jgi:hypothetical protein
MNSGELYIYNTNGEDACFDTIAIRDGEFSYKGNATDMTPFILVFPNAVEQVIFAKGGDEITYSASSNDLKNYVVEGNDENELMSRFRKEINGKTLSEQYSIARKYIEESPASIVSIFIFDKYFVQVPGTDIKDIEELLSVLKEVNPQNLFLLSVEGKLSVSGKGRVGTQLPNMEIVTRKKDTIDIARLDYDNTLIVYWASWTRDPFETIDAIRDVRDEYQKDSLLNIISVSADSWIYRWQEYIERDSIGIHNYCDGKSWDSPIIKDLGVQQLPFYIIADSTNTIIRRSHDISSMMTDLDKIL